MISKVIFVIILMINFIGCVSENACSDGFYGADCNKQCPENCITCIHENNCTKCKPRYYNGLISDTGRRQTYTHICEGQCAPNCITCYNTFTKCTACVDGYYITQENDDPGKKKGTDCTNKCFSNCKTCVSYKNCTECNDGYFGQQCDKKCPEYCTKCDKRHGHCLEKCKTGHFGPYCNLTCSRCKNKKCSFNGKCLKGCKDGFYGSFCEKTCPQNCQRNCDEEGKCYRCENGYFGERCNKTCSRNCFDLSCNQNGACNECIKRYYGPSCKTPCPKPCSVGICDKTTGICLETEQDGVSKNEVFTDERNGIKDDRHANVGGQAEMDNQTEADNLLEDCKRTEAGQSDIPYLVIVVSSVAGVIVGIVFAAIFYMIMKQRWSAKSTQEHAEYSEATGSQNATVTIGLASDANAQDRDLAITQPVPEPYEELNAMTREPNNTAGDYSALELH